MKPIKSIFGLLAIVPMVACIRGTVYEPDATATQDLGSLCDIVQAKVKEASCDAPSIGANVPIPQTSLSASKMLDMSNVISDVKKVSKNVQVSLTDLKLSTSSGDFGWLQSCTVTLSAQGGFALKVASYQSDPSNHTASQTIDLVQESVDGNQLLIVLSQPYTVTVDMQTSDSASPQDFTGHLTASVSIALQADFKTP